MAKISGVVITFNEERNIGRCLESIKDVADEIVVVDSLSTDKTEEICRQFGVAFIKQPFLGYVEQKNFAMNQAKFDYVLSLDADEALSDDLKTEILKVKEDLSCDGYAFNRLNNYCGKWIRYSGWYPDTKLRLWNKSKGEWRGEDPHDRVEMNQGAKVGKLKGDLLHYAYETVDQHLQQMHKFSIVAAQAKFAKGKKANLAIHVLLNPAYKFIRKFVFQLGFLDGYYGFVFCAAASSLNFFKYLRLYEYNRLQKRQRK